MSEPLEGQRPYDNRWLVMTKVALALLVLNFLTSFNNVWSTPYVQPDSRVGPDFVGLWMILLLLGRAVRARRTPRDHGAHGRVPVGGDWPLCRCNGAGVVRTQGEPVLGCPAFTHVSRGCQPGICLVADYRDVRCVHRGLLVLTRLIRLCIEVLAEHAAPYALALADCTRS